MSANREEKASSPRNRLSNRSKLKIAFAGILLVVVLILVVQNQDPVSTELLLWTVEAPRFAVLAFVFLVGIVTGYLFGRTTRFDRR